MSIWSSTSTRSILVYPSPRSQAKFRATVRRYVHRSIPLRIKDQVQNLNRHLRGVVFSEEDLANVLRMSTRTVKRDVRLLRQEGCGVQTRGYYEGIGRAISQKRVIVEYYLRGKTFAGIETSSRHTPQAIKRYVETFARAAYVLAHRHVSLRSGVTS